VALAGGIALNYERLPSLAPQGFGAGDGASDPCQEINAILPLTETDFASIRGNAIGEDRWSATKKVSGYATCYIQRLTFESFVCDSEQMSSETARATLLTRANALKACLGAGWTELAQLANARSLSNLSTRQVVSLMAFDFQNESTISLSIYRTKDTQADKKMGPKAPAPAAELPQNYCTELKQVTEAGKTHFESILGRKRGDSYWSSRIQLPGWSACTISEIDTYDKKKLRYFSCGVEPFPSLDETNAAVEKIATSVKACMGADWISQRRRSDGRVTIEFENTTDAPTIEIRSRDQGSDWEIKLDVNAPRR
jgi:hypothetical protein